MNAYRSLLILKITLASLFLLCLLCMPHAYYQVVRMAGFFGFFLLGYRNCLQNRLILASLCVCLGLLFQPIVKVTWGRTVWSILDVASALGLIVSIIISMKASQNQRTS